MGFIYFFDHYIKPIIFKGFQAFNPQNTGKLDFGVSCIRQGDVNFWFYTKNGKTLAVDAGHLNFPHTKEDFATIGIDPLTIQNVLVTHVDVDHCGGIDVKAKNYLYPNAQVYIGVLDEVYLEHKLHRMVRLGIKIYNCVRLRKGYKKVEDGDVLNLDGFKVQCIHVPGHTVGHMCYLVDDKILFTGDCLAVNQEGGYAFWDFFTQHPEQNKDSLKHLQKVVSTVPIVCACTGHSGFITNVDQLFAHIDQSALLSRCKAFDASAPKDVFKEEKEKVVN